MFTNITSILQAFAASEMLRLRRGDQIEVFKILNWFEKTNERSSEQQHIVACCKSFFYVAMVAIL